MLFVINQAWLYEIDQNMQWSLAPIKTLKEVFCMGYILNSLWALDHSHVLLLLFLSKSLGSQIDGTMVKM